MLRLTKKTVKSRRRAGGMGYVPQLSSISTVLKFPVHFRYICQTTGTYTIPSDNLASLIVLAETSTLTYAIFHTFRVTKLEAWCSSNVGTSGEPQPPATISVVWSGTETIDVGPSVLSQTSTSIGADVLAHVVIRPPKESLAGFWREYNGSDTSALFTLSLPQEALVDLHMELALDLTGVKSLPSLSSSGLTAGLIYFVHLDGAGGHLLPTNCVNVI